jgi:hypothetical protein
MCHLQMAVKLVLLTLTLHLARMVKKCKRSSRRSEMAVFAASGGGRTRTGLPR